LRAEYHNMRHYTSDMTLAWIASLGISEVAGLDYSKKGMNNCQVLFKALKLEGDLRCEDIFDNSFPQNYFNLVYSFGVIEHFSDPREIIRRHLMLVRPGGKALMVIPNFKGVQGWLFKRLAPDAAAMHNMAMMSLDALLQLVPKDQVVSAKAYPVGRISPWHWGLERIRPQLIATAMMWGINALGILQPFDVPLLCPLLVLELTKEETLI
ncbi:MAG TPA: class I SAM-dependent methyltransferase, partial [Acidobacteriota bacterium]|nr:class I SAM-dependent methyltransferase [Acidobacteriota bacterium]